MTLTRPGLLVDGDPVGRVQELGAVVVYVANVQGHREVVGILKMRAGKEVFSRWTLINQFAVLVISPLTPSLPLQASRNRMAEVGAERSTRS